MTLTELAGISIFVTLTFQSLVILGDSVLTSDADKNTELKSTDKRMNNFRVPVEMPFDPNFWPARGRRGRHSDPVGICDTFEGRLDKGAVGCPEDLAKKWPTSDVEVNISGKLEDDINDPPESSYYEGGIPVMSRGKASKKAFDVSKMDVLLSRLGKPRYKKQRRLPQLVLYGNGVIWEPDNPYGEKKKKQDIFWVARGKKSFIYQKK